MYEQRRIQLAADARVASVRHSRGMNDAPRLTRFDNGARVVSQRLPGREGAAVGLWILGGSRWEPDSRPGLAHLWEHVFLENDPPGCSEPLERAAATQGLGLNAHTTRELTAFTTLVTRDAATGIVERLVAQLSSGPPTPGLVRRERAVVATELATGGYSDPAEETAAVLAWPAHPMGRGAGGLSSSMATLEADDVAGHQATVMTGGRVVLAVAGDLDEAEIRRAGRDLSKLPSGPAPRPTPPAFQPGAYAARETGPARLVWAAPTPTEARDHPATHVANQILGCGLASRLFQALRKDRPLVYDVRSRVISYSDCGLWLIETVCDPRHLSEVEQRVNATMAALRNTGPSAQETADACAHLCASLRLSLDVPEATMERLAQEVLYRDEASTVGQLAERLRAVTPEKLTTLLNEAWARVLTLRWAPP